MNLIGSLLDSTWNRIGMQHIVMATGLALALSAFIGIVVSSDQGVQAPVSQPSSRSWVSTRPAQPDPQPIIYIIVGSLEHASILNRELSENEAVQLANNLPLRGRNVYVLVADGPEAWQRLDAMLLLASAEANANGVAMTVVDAR